jgi:hypothetical protein
MTTAGNPDGLVAAWGGEEIDGPIRLEPKGSLLLPLNFAVARRT